MDRGPEIILVSGRASKLAVCDPERAAFADCGNSQDRIVRCQVLERPGVAHAQHALVDRDDSSAHEDQHSHNQSPKIQLFPVSEWVRVVRWTPAAMKAKEQQHSVAGVYQGMNAFRKHSRTAAEVRSDELRGRDHQVRANCGHHRSRLFVHKAQAA